MQLSSRILYQDTCCVVVNKLKGEAVEGAQKSMALGAPKSMAGHADINWRETGIVDLPKKLKEVFGARVEVVEAVNRL